MKSFPALAFLLLCALAILALHDRAQVSVGVSSDRRVVEVLSRVTSGVQAIQHAAGERR